MVKFWSTPPEAPCPSWKGATLVLPAVAIGNVGQLAVDLVIHTLGLQRIGILESPHLLPSVGNDAYSKQGTGELAVELELYGCQQRAVYVLQQRSPVAVGCQRRFARDLLDWVQGCGFDKLLILASIDAAFRMDQHISGPQLRFVCSSGNADPICKAMGLHDLGPDEGSDGIEEGKRRTQPWPLLMESREKQVQATALCMFASEGDNIPDALHMASAAAHYLDLIPPQNRERFQWQMPGSWCSLYGPPASDAMH